MKPVNLIDDERYDEEMRTIVMPYIAQHQTQFRHQVDRRVHLHCQLLRMPQSKKCVVICHGFTESGDKFYELAYYFMQQQYSVLLVDHRGHGRSVRENTDPSTVHIRHFDDYVDDLHSAVRAVQQMLPKDTLYYLYGHSMGGGIAARTLQLHPDVYEKCILSSPMLSMATQGYPAWAVRVLSGFFIAIGRGAQRCFVQQPYDPGERFENSVCTGRGRFDYYAALRKANRHLQTNAASYRWVWEALGSQNRLFKRKNLALIHTPTLVIASGLDTTVLPHGLERFAALVPCASLTVLPNVKHEIYRSRNAELLPYLTQLFAFLEA